MFRVLKKDRGSRARLGRLSVAGKVIETPVFIAVATDGKIRTLADGDFNKSKTKAVIANTYHLWQTLGDKGLKKFTGLERYNCYRCLQLTDSGGFQVFSLGVGRQFNTGKITKKEKVRQAEGESLIRIDDRGVWFETGQNWQFLDAEKSIWIQEQLAADIVLAFDQPSSPLDSRELTEQALARTHLWAERSLKSKRSKQKIFGIVQGGIFRDLREKSAKFIDSLDFDGIAIGGAFGNSYGASKTDTFKELDWVIPYLKAGKPRHLLGIGQVRDLFVGVEKGIDLFDCVIPTREARHGTVYTKKGRINLKRSSFKTDRRLVEQDCNCWLCRKLKLTRFQLRALFKQKDRRAGRYATIHNLYFFNRLMAEIRLAIKEGRLRYLKSQYLRYY